MVARAQLHADIRAFFANRQVLEVETPAIGRFGVTDATIEPLMVSTGDHPRYLQTSPEYAMKRLLAAGSGDIFQLCKAFRSDEVGRWHNPEFSMLEWYRLGFDHYRLIREVGELVCGLLGRSGWQVWPWHALFEDCLGIDAQSCSQDELRTLARARLGELPPGLDSVQLIDLLMTHCAEPHLSDWGIVFVTDYPAQQAALARTFRSRGRSLAARFECYVDGRELANGYWEALDPDELRSRFEADNGRRTVSGLPQRPIDERFLAAMQAGLPPCAGVALGVDRLLALRLGCSELRATLAFDWTNA